MVSTGIEQCTEIAMVYDLPEWPDSMVAGGMGSLNFGPDTGTVTPVPTIHWKIDGAIHHRLLTCDHLHAGAASPAAPAPTN